MKTRTAFFTILIVTLTLVFGSSAFSAAAQTRPDATLYEQLVDQFIEKCEAKMEMIGSKLENIRRAAGVSVVKGAFAKTYRKELVNGMMEDEVGPKFYKVQVYLNSLFNRLVY